MLARCRILLVFPRHAPKSQKDNSIHPRRKPHAPEGKYNKFELSVTKGTEVLANFCRGSLSMLLVPINIVNGGRIRWKKRNNPKSLIKVYEQRPVMFSAHIKVYDRGTLNNT